MAARLTEIGTAPPLAGGVPNVNGGASSGSASGASPADTAGGLLLNPLFGAMTEWIGHQSEPAAWENLAARCMDLADRLVLGAGRFAARCATATQLRRPCLRWR